MGSSLLIFIINKLIINNNTMLIWNFIFGLMFLSLLVLLLLLPTFEFRNPLIHFLFLLILLMLTLLTHFLFWKLLSNHIGYDDVLTRRLVISSFLLITLTWITGSIFRQEVMNIVFLILILIIFTSVLTLILFLVFIIFFLFIGTTILTKFKFIVS